MLRIIRLGICLCLLMAASASVRAQAQNASQAPEITIVVGREAVRFSALNDVPEWHLVVTNQQGEVVFDSGTLQGSALEWPLKDQKGETVASGLYAYTLTTKTATDQAARTQHGHVILDRPSSADRIWVTSDRSASMGAAGTGVKLTVIGDSESTVGGAEIEATARNRDRAGEGQVGEGRRKPTTKTVTEEKQQGTSAVTASPNRIAKFAADGSTLVDSTVTESASGDIGIGTAAPGGVFDLQRSSAGDILQRLWNTGGGGAKLRYVAATGATSQLQLTDGLEWLSAIAGNNSIGLQFRVRDSGTPNSEAQLNASARMTILRNGDVGIGTTAPGARLTVQTPGDAGYGIQHRSNSVSLSSFIGVGGSSLGGWFGTRSNHPLYFFTNDGGPQMSLLQSGNVGIGTTAPGASLDVRGTRLRLQTDSGNNGPYLLLTHAGEASGHTYAIGSSGGANGPGAGSFEIYDSTAAQSRLLINPSGHITQARDKGGMIKAMVFVEGNGFISRCYNSQMADGGASLPPSGYTGCGFTVTPNFEGGSATYNINFGFQVSDRFASVTGARSGIYAASANVIYLPTTTNELGVETHIALTGEYAPASFTVILF